MTINETLLSSGAVNAGRMPARERTAAMRNGQANRWDEDRRAPWWLAGVYCSAPALFLWIAARLPADMLADLFRGHTMPQILNQLGDALFFCGWAVSGIVFCLARRRAMSRR